MNLRRPVLVGVAAVAISLIAAACSGTAATTAPSGSGQALPTVAPASQAQPSLALPSIALPSVAIPSVPGSFTIPSFSFPSEDKDLENRLPNQINGVTLTKISLKGPAFVGSGGSGTQTTLDFLAALGKTPNDLSAAFASDPSGVLKVTLGAFRVAGADSGRLVTLFVEATRKDSPEDVIQPANVGGKSVTQITDPTDAESGSTYVYANGDTLFYVESADAALAATALQAMP